MYWQKRFDRENPDQEIEAEMLRIRKEHKNYGCLRMTNELKNRGFHVNKKKVQRLIRKLGIEVRSYTRKSRRYSSYRETPDSSSLLYDYLSPKNYDRYNRVQIS